jgi:hypothetical protein
MGGEGCVLSLGLMASSPAASPSVSWLLMFIGVGIIITVGGVFQFWNIGGFAKWQYKRACREARVVPFLRARWIETTPYETFRKRAIVCVVGGPVAVAIGIYLAVR